MNWALWLLLGATLAVAALMSVMRACLSAAGRAKPAAAMRVRSDRVRALEDLFADSDPLVWGIALLENAAKIAAAFFGAMLVIAYKDARLLALCVVLMLGVLALAPLIVARIADSMSYRFCLVALPALVLAARLAGPPYAGLRRAVAARDRNGMRPFPETKSGGLGLNAAESNQSRADDARKDRAMLGGLLNLKELEVSDVMIHRTKMVMVDASEPPDAVIAAVLKSGHTRLPLFRDRPDNIIGIVNARDLFAALQEAAGDAAKIDLEKIAKPAWYVPDTRQISDQLNAFLKRKTHFALVVDEYGEVMGLITLEDILEEIVGEIVDEHDALATGVRRHADGSFTIDATAPIRDLNRALDWDLPDDEATTLAGLVIHEARMIPNPGQAFTFHGFRFEVLRKRRHQLTSLKVTPEKRPAVSS